MNSTFSGRHALIIGGSSGIGRAVAHQLSDQGAQVLVVGRDSEKLAAAASAGDSTPRRPSVPAQPSCNAATWHRARRRPATARSPPARRAVHASRASGADVAVLATLQRTRAGRTPSQMARQPHAVAGAKFVVEIGMDYEFTVANRGGMYWYHTHSHRLTAKQAYFGLASLFIAQDEDETALRGMLQLEPGVTEIPLLIQDKQFNHAGELAYSNNPMQQLMGQLGDTILVNLTPQPRLDIANRLYRLRILNGSNSRIYRLAFLQQGRALPGQMREGRGGHPRPEWEDPRQRQLWQRSVYAQRQEALIVRQA